MKIEAMNYFNGKSVYFDTATVPGRNRARSWHLQTGVFYDDRPREHEGQWYDAKGDLIEDIKAFEEKMQHAYGYIYDLLTTLQQCKIETAARRKTVS